jgi:hypothetical protein
MNSAIVTDFVKLYLIKNLKQLDMSTIFQDLNLRQNTII